MNRRPSPLEYPIVIRKHLDYLTVSMPDFNEWLLLDLPIQGKISKEFLIQLSQKIATLWVKAQGKVRNSSSRRAPPLPSNIRSSINIDEQNLTISQFSKIFKGTVSQDTIRRDIDKNLIRAIKTTGGHRRIPSSQIPLYKLYLENKNKNYSKVELRDLVESMQNQIFESLNTKT